jgi:hypothetical protein
MRPSFHIAFVLLLVWHGSPRPLRACSCIVMRQGQFLVANNTVLPANAKGVAWWTGPRAPGAAAPLASDFKVEEVTGKTTARTLPHPLTRLEDDVFLVAPRTPLRAERSYRFSGPGMGGAQQVTVIIDRVSLVPSRTRYPLGVSPVKTGSLRVRAGASCSAEMKAAQVEVALKHPASSPRFESGLLYRTLVDGKPTWHPTRSLCERLPPGRSWAGFGKDLIYASCTTSFGDGGLSRGRHTVQLEAVLPGTSVRFLSEEKTIDLVCTP